MMPTRQPRALEAETEGAGDGLREEYFRTGRIRRALPLADPTVLPALREDAALFDQAIATLRRNGRRRVPYLLTPAIERVAKDRRLLGTVRSILGESEPCVMWGPNIQRQVPNEAGRWHVDIESWHWPSITIVVGLAGCTEDNATRCIPYSHRLPHHPPTTHDAALALRAARAANRHCAAVDGFENFGDGRFYLFDARCWHCGDSSSSGERLTLFLHYQLARDPRIPCMRDFRHGTWFDAPAAYIAIGGAANMGGALNTNLYPRPRRKMLGYLALLGWRR